MSQPSSDGFSLGTLIVFPCHMSHIPEIMWFPRTAVSFWRSTWMTSHKHQSHHFSNNAGDVLCGEKCVPVSPWRVRRPGTSVWQWWRPSAPRYVNMCSRTWRWWWCLHPRRTPSCRSERWWTPGRQGWTYTWPSSVWRPWPEPEGSKTHLVTGFLCVR